MRLHCFLHFVGYHDPVNHRAGICYTVHDGDREIAKMVAEPVDAKSLREAAYRALIQGLQEAKQYGARCVTCVSEDYMLVQQWWDEAEPSTNCKPLLEQAKQIADQFDWVIMTHSIGGLLELERQTAREAATTTQRIDKTNANDVHETFERRRKSKRLVELTYEDAMKIDPQDYIWDDNGLPLDKPVMDRV